MYLGGSRSGGELLLSFFTAATGKAPLQLFMPLIVCFYLVSLSAYTGLMACYIKNRHILLYFAVIAACTGLWAYGVIAQLLGQMGGMALFPLCLYAWFLLLQTKKFNIKNVLLVAVSFTALLITYIEIAPFLGIVIILSLFKYKSSCKYFGARIKCFGLYPDFTEYQFRTLCFLSTCQATQAAVMGANGQYLVFSRMRFIIFWFPVEWWFYGILLRCLSCLVCRQWA